VDEPEFLVRDRNGNIVRVNFDRDQQAILTDLVEGVESRREKVFSLRKCGDAAYIAESGRKSSH
jgi:hypothetical protein